VSTDSPDAGGPERESPTPLPAAYPGDGYVWVTTPRRRFEHRYRTHVILFVLTCLTTTVVGALHYAGFVFDPEIGLGSTSYLSLFANGLWYAIPILVILGAHEFGHYAYCRKHVVDATLPYFIPAPIPLTGTLGAVIRIREAFPSKRALFDIGVAGPIAGFIALLPFLFWGMSMSRTIGMDQSAGYFGEPLLFKLVEWLRFGTMPEGYDSMLHPMGFAAWFGMLATALNLLPFGQLDGGHISYAVLGPKSAWVSAATLAVACALSLRSLSWAPMAVMMLAMALIIGIRHPRIVDEETPLDGRRKLVALLALIMFAICFTPIPFEAIVGQ
jgi:membrane-associated protease RseP (regulator of RpoE activity)